MNDTRCDQLDDYLADWLADGARVGFEAHLADCHVCRKQVEHQKRIDRLLAQGPEQLDPIPPSLIDTIESRIRSRERRRTVRLAWSLSTAAAAILLVGLWSVSQRARPRSEPRSVVENQDKPAVFEEEVDRAIGVASNAERIVRVVASDPSAAILVPMKTTAPNVSIVWVYPTVKILSQDPKTPTPNPNTVEIDITNDVDSVYKRRMLNF